MAATQRPLSRQDVIDINEILDAKEEAQADAQEEADRKARQAPH